MCRLAFLTLGTFTVTLGLPFTVLTFLLFAAGINLALRLAEHPGVMLGMLLKVLSSDPVITQLSISRQLVVFFDDLLRCAAHFAFWTGAVKDTVDDVSALIIGPVAVAL